MTPPNWFFPLTKYCSCLVLSMQGNRCNDQQQKKERDDDRWHDPVGQMKPGQFTLLFLGGSVRNSQSPMDAVESAVMTHPSTYLPLIASVKMRNGYTELPDQCEAQYMRLREQIEERAARKFLAMEFEGSPTYLGFRISRRKAKRASCSRRFLSHSTIISRR